MLNYIYENNTTILMMFIVLMGFYNNRIDRDSIFIFSGYCVLFEIIGEYIPDVFGALYYIGAALTDLFIITMIGKSIIITRMIMKIQKVCIWFILVNVIGWIIFESRYTPEVYDFMCTILFILILIITTQKGSGDELGNSTDSSDRIVFRGNNYPSSIEVQKNKTEEEI